MSIHSVLIQADPLEAAVRLEFPTRVLVRLFAQGQLKATEFRCLDLLSQRQVKEVL